MFPLIMGLIAVGRVFAFIIHGGGSDINDPILKPILTLGAYMLPYAFIPFTFRFAGGIFATVAGFANDKSKGLFDRQKQWRGRSWAGAKAGEGIPLLRGAAGSRRNRIAQRIATPTSMAPGRFGARARSRMSTAASGAANEGAKMLQGAGLLDDTAGNEFIQHGASLGKLQARVRELRANGQGELADQLGAYAQFAGNRQALLGAMKLNAGFGKLSDGSLKQLDTIFGNSPAERAAKQAAFGDLIFTSKNAGNYMTYSARIVDDQVKTYSDLDYQPTARQNMAKALMDTGPDVWSRMKPYTDKDSGISTKDAAALSMLENATNNWGTLDQTQQRRAIESLAMASGTGAYNDPNMKSALDRALTHLEASGGSAIRDVRVVRPVIGSDGQPVRESDGRIRTEERIENMSPLEYFRHISNEVRGGGRDPRFLGLGGDSPGTGGPTGPAE